MKTINKIILVYLLLFVFVVAKSQDFKPQIKVLKGQEYNYAVNADIEMTMSMGGQEMKMPSVVSSINKNLIENVAPDGKISVVTSVWDVKTTAKVMVDTTIQLTGKVGPSFRVVVDKFGNALSREKIDTVDMEKIQSNGMISTSLFIEFPENPLKQGEKWTKTRIDSVATPFGMLKMDIKTDYTLLGKEKLEGKDFYKVNQISTIEMSGKGEMQGMTVTVEGTGASNGDCYLDQVTGAVNSQKNITELSLSLAISGQQSMIMPMVMKVNVSSNLMK